MTWWTMTAAGLGLAYAGVAAWTFAMLGGYEHEGRSGLRAMLRKRPGELLDLLLMSALWLPALAAMVAASLRRCR